MLSLSTYTRPPELLRLRVFSLKLLGSPVESRRTRATFKNRRLRRELVTRLSLCDLLGYSYPEGVEEPEQYQPAVGLQLLSIPECVQEACQEDAVATRAVPYPPQRAVSGPKQAVPLPAGGSEERQMAKQQELRPIRESSSTGQKLGASEGTSESLLPTVRAGPRRTTSC